MKTTHAAIVVSALTAASAAHADVTLNADSEFGEETVTIDNTNQLEWLNLELTAGISYNDMVSTGLASGGMFEGWRHATRSEINDLFASAGVAMQSGSLLSPVSTAYNLSRSLGQPYEKEDLRFSQGLLLSENGPFRFYFGEAYDYDEFVEIAPYHSFSLLSDHDLQDAQTGHYLVRAVPTPGSASVLAMGVLAAARRRR